MRRTITFTTILLMAGTAAAQDCSEGCTPGYWKNHAHVWDGTGSNDYTTTIRNFFSFNGTMGVSADDSGLSDDTTLLEALTFGGGGRTALNRHAAAALASSDAGICYLFTTDEVVALYRDAIGADAGPEDIDSAKDQLEGANEAGCPLANGGGPPPPFTPFCLGDEGDCPCGNESTSGGCTNSTGNGGLLSATGSTSVFADDLVLTASGLPANATILFFMAPLQQRFAFMDGLFCVAATPREEDLRLPPPMTADADGSVNLGPGLVNLSCTAIPASGCIQAGDTWNFQGWYRDSAGPCGTGASTTNGASVTFTE